MKSRVLRDINARATVASNELLRQAYRHITRNETLPARVRYQAQLALNNFPRAAAPSAIKNRCLETGKGRGVLRDFGLCRFQFRVKALMGEVPGVRKACW
ncbi:mitochondrial 37S ribosomal protein uS14m [Calcarisporiella thermophila]|uniref:mitochondrial 37S ribosomal protein uS14m n=1 Tax=Calcarisporiella thermophila TaxID=911321 RepID=UPI003742D933